MPARFRPWSIATEVEGQKRGVPPARKALERGSICTKHCRFTKMCTGPGGPVQLVRPGLGCGTNLADWSRNPVGFQSGLHVQGSEFELLQRLLRVSEMRRMGEQPSGRPPSRSDMLCGLSKAETHALFHRACQVTMHWHTVTGCAL